MNLKQLQLKWYGKIKAKGFKDIEDNEGRLKSWSGYKLSDNRTNPSVNNNYSSKLWKESQAEYYRLAGHFLHDMEFKSVTHRKVWELHASGLTMREIGKLLKIPKSTVTAKVDAMRKEFFK